MAEEVSEQVPKKKQKTIFAALNLPSRKTQVIALL